MSADERAERSERIAGILRGELERTGVRALAAFWPMKSEPDLRPLLLEWAEADPERELLLPRVRGRAMEWVRVRGEADLEPTDFGVLQPRAELPAAAATPGIVLVPGTVFGKSGERIGRGGGFYDRALARLAPKTRAIGTCFERQLSAGPVPQEAHDRPVAELLTEEGLRPAEPPRGRKKRALLFGALALFGLLFSLVCEISGNIAVSDIVLEMEGKRTPLSELPLAKPEIQGNFSLEFEAWRPLFRLGRVRIVPDDRMVALSVDGVPVDLETRVSGSLTDWDRGFVIDVPGDGAHKRRIRMALENRGGPGGVRLLSVPTAASKSMVAAGVALFAAATALLFRKRAAFAAIFALGAFFAGWSFAGTEPGVHTYDWTAHVEYVRYIVDHRALPPPYGGWEFQQPPLYYLLAAPVLAVCDAFPELAALRGLQFLALLCALGVFWYGGKAIELLLPREPRTRNLLFALLCFWPTLLLFAPRIGNDPVFYFASAGAFWAICRWWIDRKDRSLLAACVWVSLSLLAKSNGLAALGTAGILLFLSLFGNERPSKKALAGAALILAAGVVLSFGDNVAAAMENGNHALLGDSIRGLNGHLKVGNELENYGFRPIEFLTTPYAGAWRDEGLRQRFFDYLLRSAISGEFDLGDEARFAAYGMGGALLLLVLLLLAKIARHPKLALSRRFLPSLLFGALFFLAVLHFRHAHPFSCHNDFRLALPMLFPAICMLGMDGGRRTKAALAAKVLLVLGAAAMILFSALSTLTLTR